MGRDCYGHVISFCRYRDAVKLGLLSCVGSAAHGIFLRCTDSLLVEGGLSSSVACGASVLRWGMAPSSPALEGGVLTLDHQAIPALWF